MSVFEHHRFRIVNKPQHLLVHPLGDFLYNNPALPGSITLQDALDNIVAAIYPNYIATVATPAALPVAGNPNDYYIVTDDGDGKSAGYVWQVIDSVGQWYKRYDWDWSSDNILSSAIDSVSPYYVHKWGTQDRDSSGTLFAGDLAGQRIYGGTSTGEHLILYANDGDLVGNTGYVQFGDNVRPLTDSTFTLGTNLYRFLDFFTDSLTSGTLTATSGSITDTSGAISFGNEDLTTTGKVSSETLDVNTSADIATMSFATGSITDTSGAISFGNENLSTTGTLASGTHTIGTLVLAAASITDTTGAITFDNENLLTTGTLGAGAITGTSLAVDSLFLDNNAISIATLNASLNLSANGTGVVDVQSAMTTLGQQVTGTVDITGQLNADNLRFDANTISSTNLNGNITLSPNGSGVVEASASVLSTGNNVNDLGDGTHRFRNLFLGTSLQDGTNTFTISDLMALRSTVYRDLARTQPAQAGDALFYDAINNIWLANHPDTEITHSELTGLTTTDAGHTQFAMLGGRAGGQSIQGGTAASENLNLESTAHATKGLIQVKDSLVPFTNATFSGVWNGTDLGDATHYYRDLYTKGLHKNLRLESYTYAGLPASAASADGRAVWVTDRSAIYVDNGTTWKQVGNARHIEDLAYDGLTLVKNVNVSANVQDARNCQIQLLDNTNNFDRIYATIEATNASNVRITTNIALDAGSYRLLVFE
jgi:hypothetical protein